MTTKQKSLYKLKELFCFQYIKDIKMIILNQNLKESSVSEKQLNTKDF